MDQYLSRDIKAKYTKRPLFYAADGSPINAEAATEPPKDTWWKSSGLWQAIFSGCLVITTIIHAYYFNKQWETMRAQTDAAQKSADAAKISAAIAKQTYENNERSFRLQQRPFVIVAGLDLNTPPLKEGENSLTLTLRNAGRTPGFGTVINS